MRTDKTESGVTVSLMRLKRIIFLILCAILIASALFLFFGGKLWIWIVGAWALSGPIILIDAHYLNQRKPNTEDEASKVTSD